MGIDSSVRVFEMHGRDALGGVIVLHANRDNSAPYSFPPRNVRRTFQWTGSTEPLPGISLIVRHISNGPVRKNAMFKNKFQKIGNHFVEKETLSTAPGFEPGSFDYSRNYILIRILKKGK